MVELGPLSRSTTTYQPLLNDFILQITWHILMASFSEGRRKQKNQKKQKHPASTVFIYIGNFPIFSPSEFPNSNYCISQVATTLHNLRCSGTEVFDQKKPETHGSWPTLTYQAQGETEKPGKSQVPLEIQWFQTSKLFPPSLFVHPPKFNSKFTPEIHGGSWALDGTAFPVG